MANITINNRSIKVPEGYTILQAAELAGVEIPVFCYHSRLSVAGNCRMCLVEVKGSPKPVASCAVPIAENMEIHTNSRIVKEARKGALEFLLINHPLDCPVCDQGGECDLQDIVMSYGSGESRFFENKRAVKDKNMGPLIGTSMNRCIHCTRCVRFAHDVCGAQEIGLINRGENAEITTYFETLLDSEMSGNVIDLCPVGALTSKPYSFQSRSWELKKTESIDIMDALGSAIRLDSRGMKVLRILPRLNEEINEEWISDKTRFICDGLTSQRIDKPYIRKNGVLKESSWEESFIHIKNNINNTKGEDISAVIGSLTDCESMVMIKKLLNHFNSDNIFFEGEKFFVNSKNRSSYLFNTSISGIDESDFCLMIGGNVRYDAPLINSRIRKRSLKGNFFAARVGGVIENHRRPTFVYNELGSSIKILDEINKSSHEVSKILAKSKKPMIILSQEALSRSDGDSIFKLSEKIAQKFNCIQKDWNGFNILHNHASIVGALDLKLFKSKDDFNILDINSKENKTPKILFLLGADKVNLKSNSFTIYIGHHGDYGASISDVVLPGATYTEKNATYVNTEGRVQQTYKAVPPPGEAVTDWEIISKLCDYLSIEKNLTSIEDVRANMKNNNAVFNYIDILLNNKWDSSVDDINYKLREDKFPDWKGNFFLDNVIAKNSQTMIRCAKAGGWVFPESCKTKEKL